MRKALYAFSGDPITYGHIDVVSRTASALDEVIVGIGVNPDKTYMFTLEERTEMAKKALNHLDNVKVMPVSGLLVDFAYEH
ncbi:MAG TPA: adenylyltransferase/cytidyltransferase family protein, partial [Spirochaetota bacterium]|nr:adenylyltransferase/cytidyltransferase family protein [Spirochaetota bacterium]